MKRLSTGEAARERRLTRLQELIAARGAVPLKDAARLLEVSSMTIRRDLAAPNARLEDGRVPPRGAVGIPEPPGRPHRGAVGGWTGPSHEAPRGRPWLSADLIVQSFIVRGPRAHR